jgi:hypothetical protein
VLCMVHVVRAETGCWKLCHLLLPFTAGNCYMVQELLLRAPSSCQPLQALLLGPGQAQPPHQGLASLLLLLLLLHGSGNA